MKSLMIVVTNLDQAFTWYMPVPHKKIQDSYVFANVHGHMWSIGVKYFRTQAQCQYGGSSLYKVIIVYTVDQVMCEL